MSVYFKNLDLSKIIKERRKPRSRKIANPFPTKLYGMLQESTQNCNEKDIVGWAPDGLSFQVYDAERFVAEVLPLYFRQTKFKSFQRQLSFYGFKRKAGSVDGCYSHTYFIRGNMEMCKKIKRELNHQEIKAEKTQDEEEGQAPSRPTLREDQEDDHAPTYQEDAMKLRESISSSIDFAAFSQMMDDDDLTLFPAIDDDPLPLEKQSAGEQEKMQKEQHRDNENQHSVSFDGQEFHLLPLAEDIFGV